MSALKPKQQAEAWTQDMAIDLRQFLAKHPAFLEELLDRRPKIEGATMESRAVTGSDVNGWLGAIDEIKAMAQSNEQPQDSPGFI